MITFDDLTLGYDRHPAVHHLSGQIAAGEKLAICGPNGAGKSTLLKAVAGVVKPLSGRLLRAGGDARDIAYLPQMAEVDRSFPIDVQDLVALGDWRRAGFWGGFGRTTRARVEAALADVGLTGFERRRIDTLSGGQMQRMLFARLIVQDAPLILLDEPFAAIDARSTEHLLRIVAQWQAEGRTVIAVLHDFDLVAAQFPRALLLAREVISWGATADVLTPDNLVRARRMIEAFDDSANACVRAA